MTEIIKWGHLVSGMECRNGQYYWLRDDLSLGNPTSNPFHQAQGNKHNIVQILRPSCFGGSQFPGCYGHLVAFPRAKGKVPTSHPDDVVVCYEGMASIKDYLLKGFNLFGDNTSASQFNSQRFSLVVKHLEDSARFVPVGAADVDDDERKIEALTHHQWKAFRGIPANQRVRVDGVAGSGKTILALWAAEQFAKKGQKVLFMCFNKLLKKWIEIKHPAPERQFEIGTFHSLVGRLCTASGTPFKACSSEDWENGAPIALLDAIDHLGDE